MDTIPIISIGNSSSSSSNSSTINPISSISNSSASSSTDGLSFHSYISERGAFALKEHKYNGHDDSIFYNRVMKPLTKVLVEQYTPAWVAPNLLTVAGLGCTLASFLLFKSYSEAFHYTELTCNFKEDPFFSSDIPGWVYLMCAALLFSYSVLDNMDGQQARRTGSSSPLGQLLDHGCDALNCTISTLTLAMCLRMDHHMTIRLLSCVYATFFIVTWDEYHTGEMHLAKINGADEGIVIVCLMYILTAYLGDSFWATPLIDDGTLRANQFILYLAFAGTLVAIADALRRMYMRFYKSYYPLPSHVTGGMGNAAIRLIPVAWVIMLGLVLIDKDVPFQSHPEMRPLFTLFFLIGILFTLVTSRLILCYMCKMEYPIWQFPIVLLIIPVLNSLLDSKNNSGISLYPRGPIENVCFLIAFICLVHFVYNVTRQITNILKIRVFSIPFNSTTV